MDNKKKEGGDKPGAKSPAGAARGTENMAAPERPEPPAVLPPTQRDVPVVAPAADNSPQAPEAVVHSEPPGISFSVSAVKSASTTEAASLGASTVPDTGALNDKPQAAEDGLAVSPEQARSWIELIKAEADELTQAQRAHLHSHLIANPLHDLNERCFTQGHSFRQMTITFNNLRANSKAFLSILPDQQAIWSEGGGDNRMVGLSFSATTQPTMYLRNFLINAREMYLESYQDCSQIELDLYVRTEQTQLKGKVDLPPGASVTLKSRCDRTSIIGLSSFGIDLE